MSPPKLLLPANVRSVSERFNAERALATILRVHAAARGMDSRSVWKAAEVVADELQQAGLRDVRTESLPADGATVCGGWLMPVAWRAFEARLRTAGRGRGVETLADFRVAPQHLALYSPGTPGGRCVEGPVATVADPKALPSTVRGAFLRVAAEHATPEFSASAAAAGALGILVAAPNDDPSAVRYLNDAVPLQADRPCVPCFSLNGAGSARLDALLKDDPRLRLVARVRARRTVGTLPLVTGILGAGTPSLYLCAHLDEPGAQDNASGVGVAIETLRTLAAAPTHPRADAPPPRAIQVFFSVEVRGLQAWQNRGNPKLDFLAGLNLDMVACAPRDGRNTMVVRRGFRGQTHFAGTVLEASARWADATVGGMVRKTGDCGVSDALFGRCPHIGHVSLEQRPGPHYHTHLDAPAVLDQQAARWTGVASTAFLDYLRRLDDRRILSLGRTLQQRALRAAAATPADSTLALAQAREEILSLRRALRRRNLFGTWDSPAAVYRAGVRRSSGCWPWVDASRQLTELAANLPEPAAPWVRPTAAGRLRRLADALVPVLRFHGFLSFEDERASSLVPLGLDAGWGAERWAWTLAAQFRGKATVAEVVDRLERQGFPVALDRALALAHHLVAVGKARFRPVLDRAQLARAFRAIGVRRNSILCVHAGLSHFGYIAGGARTLVDALRDVVGPRGTLCVPTHSLSVLGNEPYDRERTPSCLGAFSEFFRTQPGVMRSPHPTHSVAAQGPAAADLTHLARIDSAPLARDGFWGRLYDSNGDVLLLCPLRSATIFHAGEAWTGVPQPPLFAHVRQGDGSRQIVTVPQGPWHVDHFERDLAAPLLESGVLRKAPLGEGHLFFSTARAMADISVEANRRNPLVSLRSGDACRCFYCASLRNAGARP